MACNKPHAAEWRMSRAAERARVHRLRRFASTPFWESRRLTCGCFNMRLERDDYRGVDAIEHMLFASDIMIERDILDRDL